jgi:tryptophan synthase beta chain
LHQTVVGLETKEQMAKAGYYPDVVIGCVGGGSNFSGFAFPFAHDKITRGTSVRLVAVEPTACPTLTRGLHTYDFGDVAGYTPLLYMHTLGSSFIPPGIHAGGLRYHGDAPLLSQLVADGIIEAQALHQKEIFQGAILFARSEGIVPAPEAAHAIRWAIKEAEQAKQEGRAKTILFNLSGHGLLDLSAYDNYLSGKLIDYPLPEDELQKALAKLLSK